MFTQIHQFTTHLLLYKTTCTHLTPRHLSTHTSLLSFTLHYFTLLHTSKWDPLLPIYTSLRVSRTFLYNGKINSSPSFQHILVYGSLQIVVSYRDFQRDREISREGSRNFQREGKNSRKLQREASRKTQRNFQKTLEKILERERRCLIFNRLQRVRSSILILEADDLMLFMRRIS